MRNENAKAIQNVKKPRQDLDKKIKVLVVEDDRSQWPLWEDILKTALDGRKCEIDWLTTAEEAQKFLSQAYRINSPYEVVISDVVLEGLGTGVDLWNRYGEAAHHFIFVSGQVSNSNELKKGMAYGDPIFLEKPLPIQKCKGLLKEIFEDL